MKQRKLTSVHIEESLKAAAKIQGLNVSQFINEALRQYLTNGSKCPTCNQVIKKKT